MKIIFFVYIYTKKKKKVETKEKESPYLWSWRKFWVSSLPAAKFSNPLDNFNISAPKTWSAVIVALVASWTLVSGSHNSWFSKVVKSVSVEAFECCWWIKFCGVAHTEDFSFVSTNFLQVHLLSIPATQEQIVEGIRKTTLVFL